MLPPRIKLQTRLSVEAAALNVEEILSLSGRSEHVLPTRLVVGKKSSLGFVACDGFQCFALIEVIGKRVVRFCEHDRFGITLLQATPNVLMTSHSLRIVASFA